MKVFSIIILLVTLVPACTSPAQPDSATPAISFEVRADNADRNLYYVQWHDTLGQAEGYTRSKWVKRPKEVWCVITNKNNDTLGRYMGSSTAQNFANFQSKDSIVVLHFMMGVNFFSDLFNEEKDVDSYVKEHQLPRKYGPITVDIRKELNKTTDLTPGMSSL